MDACPPERETLCNARHSPAGAELPEALLCAPSPPLPQSAVFSGRYSTLLADSSSGQLVRSGYCGATYVGPPRVQGRMASGEGLRGGSSWEDI